MTTSISCEAQKIMNGQTDKVTRRDSRCSLVTKMKIIQMKNTKNFCITVADRLTDGWTT